MGLSERKTVKLSAEMPMELQKKQFKAFSRDGHHWTLKTVKHSRQ